MRRAPRPLFVLSLCVFLGILPGGVDAAPSPYGEAPLRPSVAPEPPTAVHDTNDPWNVVSNGGFEAGLADWITTDLPAPLFAIDSYPTGTPVYFTASSPTEGSFGLAHGWDGDGPGVISAAQDVVLSGVADVLLFDYRAQWDLTAGATLPRTFRVQVQPWGGGAPLLDEPVLEAPPGTSDSTPGWVEGSVGLSAFAGQAVRLVFLWDVPENFTGPAEFELDNVLVRTLTIQEQIDAAPVGGTVTLLPGTYSGIGNRDLDFNGKNLVLQGAGIGQTIVDCQGAGRGMFFSNGETPASRVEGITFVNGSASDGGAVYILGASPQFVGCSFESNIAFVTSFLNPLSNTARGGAVFVLAGSPVFQTCLFVSNRADAYSGIDVQASGLGGAVYVDAASPVFQDCTFEANTAFAQSDATGSLMGCGGAIFNLDGDPQVFSSRIEGNTCTGTPSGPNSISGGGVASLGGTVLLDDVVMTGNEALGGVGDGGGVSLLSGNLTLNQASLIDNFAGGQGGGLFCDMGLVVATGSVFRSNLSGLGGGGAHLGGGAFHEFTDCEFESNVSGIDGGGIEVLNALNAQLTRCRVVGNSAARWGGGVMLNGNAQVVEVVETRITGNHAIQGGGGVGGTAGGAVRLDRVTVAGNRSDQDGGGIGVGLGFTAVDAFDLDSVILWGNEAAGLGDEAWVNAGCTLTADCSVVNDPGVSNGGTYTLGSDCSTVDPGFCAPEPASSAPTTAGNYGIAAGSPAASQNLACGVTAGSEPISCSGGGITAVVDVPNDQGRRVRVGWDRSPADVSGSPVPIYQYSLWRRVEPGLVTTDPVDAAVGSRADLPLGLTSPPGDWVFLETIPASGQPTYLAEVPTVCDSTIGEGQCLSTFFVRAHTATPTQVFDGPGASGYSVDNLAPGVPLNLVFDGPTTLAWDESAEADWQYYTVYGSNTGAFDGSQWKLGNTAAEAYDVAGTPYPFFLVTVTDFAGNEGDPAVVSRTVSAPTGMIPAVAALHPASPNPFRSSTRIAFDLPASGSVRIEVFDLSGRSVRLLEDGVRPAGRHTIRWDGRGDRGRALGVGIYFVRFRSEGVTEVRKVVLQQAR